MPVLRLILVVCVHVYSTLANEYCEIASCKPGQHTMCIFDTTVPACDEYEDDLFTVEEQKQILDIHNKWRNKVAMGEETRGTPGPQPQASNMRQLNWDGELRIIAQRWALQCQYEHDKCRNTARFRVGQNIAASTDLKKPIEPLIQQWYEEVEQTNNAVVDSFQSSPSVVIGHYTQAVWGETHLVGCARAIFTESGQKWVFIFCNYGPAGNMLGGQMYFRGEPGSNCTDGTSRSTIFPGLCATPDQIQGEDGSGKDPQTQLTWVLLGGLSILLTVL